LENNFNNHLETNQDEDIDIRRLIGRLLKYWYLLVIFLPLSLSIAYVYLRYTNPVFESSTIVLIKDEKESGKLSEEQILSEIGLGQSNKKIDNEILVFQSSLLMKEVVEKLQLEFTYIGKGRVRNADLYIASPVKITNWVPKKGVEAVDFELELKDAGMFVIMYNDVEYKGEFGKTIFIPAGSLNITFSGDGINNNTREKFEIKLRTSETAAISLSKNIKVEQEGKKTSALRLRLEDPVAQRATDVLNELVNAYNRQVIIEKNKVYENTLRFIDERITLLTQELNQVEGEAESYKSKFSMVDMSAEGSMILTEIAEYRKELTETDVQLEILNSIEAFLNSNKENFEFVPTNLSLNNLTLTGLLQRFNTLLEERAVLMATVGSGHPNMSLMNKQLSNLRLTIIDNIKSIKKDLLIVQNSTKTQNFNLQKRLQSLPARERELVEIERQKAIKENLYVFLLQKREETALSLAVASGSALVIEPARNTNIPIKPKPNMIWLIALGLGLLLPMALAYLLDMFNDKIETESDIASGTSTPVAGIVAFSSKKESVVVHSHSRSAIAEMFRLLRANLNFIASGHSIQTLLMTSSISGEGKSFIALNLGMTQAISGKKVLILELDLRKPKQELYIGMEERSKMGISNYIVDEHVSLNDIIQQIPQHENMYVIASGPKPPNPGELILSPRLRELMLELREKFDFIILDAPPVGLVADALQLADLADASLYVVRQAWLWLRLL